MPTGPEQPVHPNTPAGVLRRFGALLYDSVLLAAILLLASVPPVLLNGGPLRDGSPYAEIKNFLYFLYLLTLVFLFYGWFWTHNGQTLGMAAWRIRVLERNSGSKLSWKQALIRFSTGLLGLANLWACFDPQGLGWHERLSNSKTVYIPRT